jgi:hypothetical protein
MLFSMVWPETLLLMVMVYGKTTLFLHYNAIIFLAPITEDILNLSNILEGYGEVTGLCTNF